MSTHPSVTCPSCGHLVTGQWHFDVVAANGKGVDRRCACGRFVIVEGEIYERVGDRER